MSGLGDKVAAGSAWMIGVRLIDRTVGLLSTIILARLLLPADFGLVVMATAVIAVVDLLQAFSFEVALIQKRDATRQDFDTAWTLTALLALACGLLLVVVAQPMAVFYNEPRIAPVLQWLAIPTVLLGLENVGLVALRKELNFKREFGFLASRRLVTFGVTIAAALILGDYWALVVGTALGRVVSVVLSYAFHPYRPRPCLASIAYLLHFSKWLLVNNGMQVVLNRAPDFVIGRLLGPGAVGLFSISFELATLPTSELSAPINRAVFPAYSKIAGDVLALRGGYIAVMGLVALVTIPAAAGISAIAPMLVPVLLGPGWLRAIPLIEVLAWYGLVASLLTNSGYVFLALRKPRIVTALTAGQAMVLFPCLLYGVSANGVSGASLAPLVTGLLAAPVVYVLLRREIGLRARDLVQVFWRPIAASGVMIASLDGFARLVGAVAAEHHVVAPLILLTAVLVGVLVYGSAIWVFWLLSGAPSGAETRAFSYVSSAVYRFSGGRIRLGSHASNERP